MQNSTEALKQAVDSIKSMGVRKGKDITEKEMAGKMDIPEKQLYAFLNGEDPTPADLPLRLMSAFNIKTYIVHATQVVHVREPRPAQNESARAKNNRNSLKTTISFIKKIGEEKGIIITDEEMAGKIDISTKQLYAYSTGKEKTPDDISSLLLTAYADLINSFQMESNRESLKHAVHLIRNRGLNMGVDVTVEEMAGKIDISAETLYAYLNDENAVQQDDLSHRLRLAYKDLLKNLKKVEIIEDINMIKNARK